MRIEQNKNVSMSEHRLHDATISKPKTAKHTHEYVKVQIENGSKFSIASISDKMINILDEWIMEIPQITVASWFLLSFALSLSPHTRTH